MSLMAKQKVYKIEMAIRTSADTWDSFTDITGYFSERLGAVSLGNLQDDTLEGNITQGTVSLRFDNTTGAFNKEGTDGSLWSGASEYLYHSRIRYWEYYEGETPSYPLLDGLIARSPVYKKKYTADLIINSRLDILRDHFILENVIGRVKRAGSHPIMNVIIDVLNNNYSALGMVTTQGLFRKEVLYDDITPYSNTLLAMSNRIIQDGGGIGGLRQDNKLVYSYFEATEVTKRPFQDDADTLGLWLFAEAGGTVGTDTLADSSASHDLTTINNYAIGGGTGFEIVDNVKVGFYNNAFRNWYRVLSSEFTDLTDYTLDFIVDVDTLRIPRWGNRGLASNPVWEMFSPLWVWGEHLGSYPNNLLMIPRSGVAGTAYAEGFVITQEGTLNYILVDHTGGDGVDPYTVIENTELMKLSGEGFLQMINISIDLSELKIKAFLNGKLKKIHITSNLGFVSADNDKRLKIVGCGFPAFEITGPQNANYIDKLGKVYYHCMRIRDTFISTDSDAYDLYEQSFGNNFNWQTDVNTHVIDNLDEDGKLLSILSHSTGEESIKNIVLLDDNTTAKGFNIISFNDTSGTPGYWLIVYKDVAVSLALVTTQDNAELVELINTNTTLIEDFKISASYIEDNPIPGSSYTGAVLIETDGSNYLGDYTIEYVSGGAISLGDEWVDALYSVDSEKTASLAFITLMPYGDNQFFKAEDTASQVAYGKRIKKVTNDNLITTPGEIQDQLQNVLDNSIDPRERVVIHVPFNYNEIDVLDIVSLRLKYEFRDVAGASFKIDSSDELMLNKPNLKTNLVKDGSDLNTSNWLPQGDTALTVDTSILMPNTDVSTTYLKNSGADADNGIYQLVDFDNTNSHKLKLYYKQRTAAATINVKIQRETFGAPHVVLSTTITTSDEWQLLEADFNPYDTTTHKVILGMDSSFGASEELFICGAQIHDNTALQDSGDFRSFNDEGSYRFKTFRITNVTHAQDGKYSSLKLIEKL